MTLRRFRLGRTWAVGAALAVLLAGAGCADETKPAASEPTLGTTSSTSTSALAASSTTTMTSTARAPAPYQVLTFAETFVDTSRPSVAGVHTPPAPSRTLVTTIVYPEVEGPSPLIVLSHGSGGSTTQLLALARAWAAAGFVVALPTFPLTNSANGGANASDVVNQPADVSFVIDHLVAENADTNSAMSGRIDPRHIGVAGHSLGGATTYGVAYAPCCRDPRITAAIILSGVRLIDQGHEEFDKALPTLVFHGSTDTTLPYSLGTDGYAALHAPKWFVTLDGAGHSPPYQQPGTVWFPVVAKVSTDFWQAELGGDTSHLAAMTTDANVAGVSSLQSDPG